MRQFIILSMLFCLISCKQGLDRRAANNVKIIEKNIGSDNYAQINTKSYSANENETEINKNNTPADIALTFINLYVDNCNKLKESLGILEWVNSNEMTTNQFKTKVKSIIDQAYKKDPEIGLGFDPIFDAQDYPDKGFELEIFDSKTNFIVVKGKNWADFKLTIKLVMEDNKWLIDGCGIVNIPHDKRSTR